MKKIVLFLSVICVIMASCTGIKSVSSTVESTLPAKTTEKQTTSVESELSPTEKKLVGLWHGEDQGEIGYLKFEPDGYAFFIIDGDTLGGRSFHMEGMEGSMTYNVNEKDTPKSINFDTKLKNLQEPKRLSGIIKFTENGELMLSIDFGGGTNLKSFIEEDTVILEKVNEEKK